MSRLRPVARIALSILLLLLLATTSAASPTCEERLGSARIAFAALGNVTVDRQLVEVENRRALRGAIRVFRDDKPIAPEPCMPLEAGDIVETTHSSTAVIEFRTGMALLMPNSSVRLSSDGKGYLANHTSVWLSTVWTFFGEVFAFGRMTVRDRYVTAGSEGTSYVVRSERGRTSVTVLEGRVRCESAEGAFADSLVQGGERLRVDASAPPSRELVPVEVATQDLAAYRALTGFSAAYFAFKLPALLPPIRKNTLSLLVEASAPTDFGGGRSLSTSVGWSHRFVDLGGPPLDVGLGTRLLVGGAFGQYRSPMTDPASGREESPGAGTGRLPFYAAVSELDLELQLRSRAALGYTVGVGFRAGASHQPDVDGAAVVPVFGPVVLGRFRWRWGSGFWALLQLDFALQRTPVAAMPIGCTDPALPRTPVWDVWSGLGFGLEAEL